MRAILVAVRVETKIRRGDVPIAFMSSSALGVVGVKRVGDDESCLDALLVGDGSKGLDDDVIEDVDSFSLVVKTPSSSFERLRRELRPLLLLLLVVVGSDNGRLNATTAVFEMKLEMMRKDIWIFFFMLDDSLLQGNDESDMILGCPLCFVFKEILENQFPFVDHITRKLG